MNYPDLECPILGILHYDVTNDWYKGQLKIQQSEVTIYFSMDEERKLESAQNRFVDVMSDLKNHLQQAKEYAVESLLAVKNEIDENRPPLTPQQFKDRMVLQFISIEPDGSVSFYYPDDNLFAGHFYVMMDSVNNFVDADIPH
ncbi:DUF2262 domain-containing protein [Chamaesiphon sp. VAR_48_metabat_403]|uniref:DUF2262 domain-containing protein n=1 Tax=Chamaesiphon sp. VAR_48_metabat_403 TaxID=2964700 RepID=UPI00286E45EB|nr:DUF2262 domain-containing protein [Chamaesiphon sp. VAR_48_metabat_403]